MLFSLITSCFVLFVCLSTNGILCQDIIGCGGFVKSEVEINFSLIEVKLYTKQGSLKYQTDCAPNNGYYMIPVYDKGDYVLKVEPPPGWTFDPQSIELHIDGKNDLCSKNEDINFEFTGFGVVGKVVSKGQSVGPSGIQLSLKKPGSKDILKKTLSTANGAYNFEKVLPGEYVVEGAHEKWQFEQASTTVTVGRESGSNSKPITVHGYDVSGMVTSEGEAVEGVNFVLFSDTLKTKDVKGCQTKPLKDLPKQDQEPLCYAMSAKNGRFAFDSLPVGQYTLMPFYKGQHITFDVVPARLTFTVGHDSLALKDKFVVAGFSVSGKVLNAKKGKGIPGAEVYVNGKQTATTGKDGVYHLDSMTSGTYTLGATASRLVFPDTKVTITSTKPQLPDLIAERYSVCGRVIIDKVPSGLERVTSQRKVKVTGAEVTEVTTNDEGKFCADLKSGDYVFKIVLTDQELKAGLKLAPAEKEVTVKDSPIDSVTFSQFRANVKGTLSCLESCGAVQLALAATGRVDERRMTQATPSMEKNKAVFDFADIMPGKYRVSVLSEEWCWEERGVEIEVVDKDVTDVTYKHTGYILACSLSHDITLNFEQDGKPGHVGSFNLTKGTNKFCLSEPGVYTLIPQSCHQFEQQQYKYDTSKPSVLTLSAVRHLVEGRIVTQAPHGDIMVSIKSSAEDKPISIGPLTADKPESSSKDAKKKTETKDPKSPTTYSFSYWARGGEKLEVTASSKVLLFYPDNVAVTVSGSGCPGIVAQIEGRPGVFISGNVKPALAGVKVTINTEGHDEIITVETDQKGGYRVGPLHSDRTYSVDAEKPGYVLTAQEGKQGHFNAFKLAEILVKVEGEGSEKLSGVLLSLSGGPSNYRSNQLSKEDGSMQFIGLSPGQYFLRPMMKEYKFEPSSQMIEVQEGITVNLKITGTRVAFSCYGSVTSLNGEPEAGVFVEALGQGSEQCESLQEEGKTEADGSFRIRGLQPNCDYEIQLSKGEANPHIERTAPKSRPVKVTQSDLKDINIIAFRRMNQMDLSGNIVTAMEHLPHIKVQLFRESEPDSPIHTVRFEGTSFFHLPSLTIDNQAYMLRLASTLSRSTYTYTLAEVSFLANTTYRHFTVEFDPQPRSVEQELSQGSFLILPLTALVIFISYNSDQVLPLVYQFISFVKGMIQGTNRRSSRSATPPPPSPASLDNISPELLMPTHKPKMRKT